MTNLSKNSCDLSKIPGFTEFFQEYKPRSIADFTFKSGSNNYEIIEDNDLSSIKLYSHKTQFLIRKFIEELQDNEILLLNFFGIKLDSFSDITQDEDHTLLRTIALSSWHELTNANTIISLSRNKFENVKQNIRVYRNVLGFSKIGAYLIFFFGFMPLHIYKLLYTKLDSCFYMRCQHSL